MSQKALGKVLVENNIIDVTQLEKAKGEQKRTGAKLADILLKQGLIDHKSMREQLADLYGFPAIDLASFELDEEALSLMTGDQCVKHGVIPVSKAGASLVVAFSDPSNLFAKDDIAFLNSM